MKALRLFRPAGGTLEDTKGWTTRQLWQRVVYALIAPALVFSLTGCVTTRIVDKTILAPDVREATLDELLKKLTAEYGAVQTLSLTVDITATEGGTHQGQIKTFPSFAGYILLRKPADLHVIMKVPFVGSRAMDMVSDGRYFKMLIPPKNRAVIGSEILTNPSKNGLENLRPNVIRDALQIPPVGADEFVTLTENSRLITPAHGHKEAIEEPDYDLSVLRMKAGDATGHVLERVRVIHVSRVTLLPYQLDLYDAEGRVVTTISYSKFQKFGDVDYPMSILLKRPIDEYTLQIDISKLVLNQKLDDESFKLTIPDGVPVQKM
jgi:outer membrane lipoprotein-sorting protein